MKANLMNQDSKVLVTGGLGFIGSNFILKILDNSPNCQIFNLDAEIVGSNKKSLVQIKNKKNYHYIKGNINKKKSLKNS